MSTEELAMVVNRNNNSFVVAFAVCRSSVPDLHDPKHACQTRSSLNHFQHTGCTAIMPSSAVNRKASAVLPVSLLAFIGVLVSLLLAAEWSCTLSSSFSCWLSSPWFAGSPPRDYLPGEVLPLRATEATSVRTLLPLPPYHLPSCRVRWC